MQLLFPSTLLSVTPSLLVSRYLITNNCWKDLGQRPRPVKKIEGATFIAARALAA
jgi:hypothetical protein